MVRVPYMHKLANSVHQTVKTVANDGMVTIQIRQSFVELQGPYVESDA